MALRAFPHGKHVLLLTGFAKVVKQHGVLQLAPFAPIKSLKLLLPGEINSNKFIYQPLEVDTQKVCPDTFQVLPPRFKSFLRPLYLIEMWNKSNERYIWRVRLTAKH